MRSLFVLAILLGFHPATAQTPVLERKISITLNGETLAASLKKVSESGGFVFSYDPAILEAGKTVHHRFENQSVREVLDALFEGAVSYKVHGNYIILKRLTHKLPKKQPEIITGYVVDQDNGSRLDSVNIYDPITLSSAITDAYGYFELTVDRPAAEVILAVNRKNYWDTLVTVPSSRRLLNIPLRINRKKISAMADSLEQKVRQLWTRPAQSKRDAPVMNAGDTLYRFAQISFVPFVGTNARLSGRALNALSFNVLGGYALGLQKFELGGLFNLESGSMRGAQVAGVYNGVAGGVHGAQFAGVANVSTKTTTGVQFAGVVNVSTGAIKGAQFAGVANVTTGPQDGPQLAGAFNLSTKENQGAQLSGAINLAMQEMKGLQLAGLFNIGLKNVEGVQIAGLLNYARSSSGLQVAPFNIADTTKGIPLGLISFVRKGYHKIEVSVDEVFYNNLSFRTGVDRFYNILTVGAKPSTYEEDETFWTFGYGLGTAPRLVRRKLFLNVDLTSNQLVHGNRIKSVDLLNKLYLGLDYQILKKVSLAFGTTLNVYITKVDNAEHASIFTDYAPHVFFNRAGDHHQMKMWIGGKVALRFL